ncbi:uncharacterized protein LOC142625330 [Castanea sativa]|uniref:uncharacterized protein LOC142625330 n=1 Tax=Castanea sativa TaxID=21020 RepID=UPI003F64A1FC
MAFLLGKFVLHNSVDCREYDDAWDFLKVPPAGTCNEWYGKCIQACNLTCKGSTEEYEDLLGFLAANWRILPRRSVNKDNGKYVELGVVYAETAEFARECTPENELLHFFKKYEKTSNLTLYLKKCSLKFIESIQNWKWIRTYLGFNSPSQCFLCDGTEISTLLEIGKTLKVLSAIDEDYYMNRIRSFRDELIFIGLQIGSKDMHQLINDDFKCLASSAMSTKCAIFLLSFIKYSNDQNKLDKDLLKTVKARKWLKTNQGRYYENQFDYYEEELKLKGVLIDPKDHLGLAEYYGRRIVSYKAAVEAIRVVVDINGACTMLSFTLKSTLSSSNITCANVFSLLNCISYMNKTIQSQLLDIISCLSGEKWLKTCHGYKSAPESILFDPKWGTVFKVVDLPFIDEAFYGLKIHSYKCELNMLNVVTNLSEGAHIVARGLKLPKEPASLAPKGTLSRLQCATSLRNSCKSTDHSTFKILLDKLTGAKWLKIYMGYRSPQECIMFNPEWECYLTPNDGLFIDEKFYVTVSSLEKEDLKAIGVKVDIEEACHLISRALMPHIQTSAVRRIYRFLHKFNWNPQIQDTHYSQLWIPDQQAGKGKWVENWRCILHDQDHLFDARLDALDKYYEKELLPFLSRAFGVREFPSPYDYLDIWNSWEATCQVSTAELSSFLKTGILTLELKREFTEASEKPLFAWFPPIRSSSQAKLLEIYASLGVRKISKAVQSDLHCTMSASTKI